MDQNLSLVARGKRPLVPSIAEPICARCRGVLEQSFKSGHAESEAFDYQAISESVSSGCRICCRSQYWLEHANPRVWHGRKFTLVLMNYSGHERPHYGPFPNACERTMHLSLRPHDFTLSNPGVTYWLEPIYKEGMCPENFAPLMIQNLRPANTRNPTAINLIKNWMRNCLHNHNLCNATFHNSSVNASHVPARLISVNTKTPVRLVELDRRRACNEYRYATLTHRWQEGIQLSLSQLNRTALEQRIDVPALSAVFRDAIELCQFLGIDYLWIDRLCIIQDDPADLAREIANMGYIYENALLNIGGVVAASQSAKAGEGLFVDRADYARHNDPMCIPVRRKGYDELCWGYQGTLLFSLNESAMMLRGWILQERLLSPRSIYFDYQLRWECSELIACEYFPDGVPRRVEQRLAGRPTQWGTVTPLKIKSLLLDARFIAEQKSEMTLENPTAWTSQYQCWMMLIEQYSRCQLTHESDCFLALSGLAKHFAREFDDEYLAGLWRKEICEQLLWYIDKPRCLPDSLIDLQACSAPTWSWASRRRDGISFLFNKYSGILNAFSRTTEIERVTVVLKGNDPTGNVFSGMMRIRGPLRKTLGQIRKKPQNEFTKDHLEWWDEGYYRSGYRVVRNNYHLLIGYIPYNEVSGGNHSGDNKILPHFEGMKIGLILESVSSEIDVYRRVGVFMHISYTWEGDWYYPKPALGYGEEYKDFDLNNYECQTITVV